MFLVELFVPLRTPDGAAVPLATLERIKEELTAEFDGVTAFLHSPADGCWKPAAGRPVVHDRIAVFEIMTGRVNRRWWGRYRRKLERELKQEVILARVHPVMVI